MSNIYNGNIKFGVFGQSHSEEIGVFIEGLPAGIEINTAKLQEFMNRRKPGQWEYTTSRKEEDTVQFVSGLVDGITCGAPLLGKIKNTNIRSKDYDKIKKIPRPGHSDYTAHIKTKGYNDIRGGGEYSGRLTAPICVVGGILIELLKEKGIEIKARIKSIKNIVDYSILENDSEIAHEFAVIDDSLKDKMKEEILIAKNNLDSVGGIVECGIFNVPAGLGAPMFDGVENIISRLAFGIPAIKGIEFGEGFSLTTMYGSESNDEFVVEDNKIKTITNNMGGILGGITSSMPIIFRVAIKPTPSIAKKQKSVNIETMENAILEIKGRHDPCIVPRVVPVIESIAAIGIYDLMIKEEKWI